MKKRNSVFLLINSICALLLTQCTMFGGNSNEDEQSGGEAQTSVYTETTADGFYIENTTVIGINNNNVTSITIPEKNAKGEFLTDIGEHAFIRCKKLHSVNFAGNNIRHIRTCAFLSCSGLVEINLPNSIETIEDSAFASCTYLANITLPDSVITLGDGVFNNCRALAYVKIPEGITKVGDYFFQKCHMLYAVNIPKSVTSFGEDVFNECEPSLKLFYQGNMQEFAAVQGGNSLPVSVHYYSEDRPSDDEHDYWHYSNGNEVVWPKINA